MSDMTVFFTVAGFVLDEDSAGNDPVMVPVQGGIDAKLANRFDVKLALTYYEFMEVQNNVLDFSAESNTLTPDGVLMFDYDAFSVSGEVGFDFKLFGNLIPYGSVFGDYVVNLDPDDDNQGFLVGVGVGHKRTGTPGQWQFKYLYRRLERDAWPDVLPDSDFFGGATNAEGHKIIAVVGVYKNVSLGISYYHTEEIEGDTDEDAFRFDVSFSF